MRLAILSTALCVWLTMAGPLHAAKFQAVAISPDGSRIAAGGDGGRVCVWELGTANLVQDFRAGQSVTGLAFVGSARTLAIGMFQGGVEIWAARPDTGFARTKQFGGSMIVYALAASPDGKTLAASCHNGFTYLYDTATWTQAGVIYERSNLTCDVHFSRDGALLATAGNTFSLWDVRPASTVWHRAGVQPSDGDEAASAHARRWAAPTPREEGDEGYCAALALSPDGHRAAGVNGTSRHDGGGKRLFLWDAGTGQLLRTSRSTGLTCVTFMADGKFLATGSDDGILRVWDPLTGQQLHEARGHTRAIRDLAPLPDGSTFVTAGEDGTAALWDARTCNRLREFRARD